MRLANSCLEGLVDRGRLWNSVPSSEWIAVDERLFLGLRRDTESACGGGRGLLSKSHNLVAVIAVCDLVGACLATGDRIFAILLLR